MSSSAPRKRILTQAQLQSFQSSQTHKNIVAYVEKLNESVVGVELCGRDWVGFGELHEGVVQILDILDRVEEIVKDCPPVDNSGSRFGNPAFRVFYDRIQEVSGSLHKLLGKLPEEYIPEVSTYFNESWGNRTRIDYGSGMELNFVCWLYCLSHLGVLPSPLSTSSPTTAPNASTPIVILIFWRYITLMRALQSTYWLEPAGSHGVWGLDDYHFLPFLWGSAQLITHKWIRPKSIHDQDVVRELGGGYMYFKCIQWVNEVKTASLRWHSPMLDDISAVKTWSKVNSGMIKMYLAEVLGKLPVMQHFLFGSILSYEGPDVEDVGEQPECGHSHDLGGVGQHQAGWANCCGIPVPSVFGAVTGPTAPSTGKVETGSLLDLRRPGIRAVPFD